MTYIVGPKDRHRLSAETDLHQISDFFLRSKELSNMMRMACWKPADQFHQNLLVVQDFCRPTSLPTSPATWSLRP